MGVMMIFFFYFFFFVMGVKLVCIALEHIKTLIPLYFYFIILIQICGATTLLHEYQTLVANQQTR